MSESGNTKLRSRVKAVWRREQTLRFAEGALAFLRWGIPVFVVGVAIDWLADLTVAGRAAILIVVLAVPVYGAWRAGWKHVRPFNSTRTALQIEEQKGGMESLLVSALQFQEVRNAPGLPGTVTKSLGDGLPGTVTKSLVPGTSEALCDLTCRKAEGSASEIKPAEAIRFRSLRRPAAIALGVVLLLGALTLTHGPILLAGLSRIFMPWLAIAYPTRTQLELLEGDVVAQEGKPVRIAASVSGDVPQEAEIEIRTGKGRPRVRRLSIVDGECEYLIETAFRGFNYRIKAGDARSDWHTVEVINSPSIERAEVRLEFPGYIERPPETVGALTVSVPETTLVQWALYLDRAVSSAAMNLAGQDPKPLEVSADGRKVTIQQLAAESRAYGFSWVERDHGFKFRSPNYYLQVAPDRPPRVELTSPRRNIYATLGRKMELAFRGRDDHGIAESVVAYRVNKTEEVKVPFTPVRPVDGTEQKIDWDYRTVLTNLVVGQVVTFAVELADAYPGENGPHRARSDARRIQFLSMDDYLARVKNEMARMLSQLKAVYREERHVYEVVLRLDQSDPVFIQTCQLEAVRQDLLRERVNKLAGRMGDLADDLAANSVTNQSMTETLVQLQADLQRISAQNVAEAANALRVLAGESGGSDGVAKDRAAHMVNSSARELGLLVLRLGFKDAADVMAREMHAAAETQAYLRLRTIMQGATGTGKAVGLPEMQERLGKWLSRLFAASPKGKESTIEEALIEFTLTRLVKQLINGGVDRQLHGAAALIRKGESVEAARVQSGVIAALLRAEFRLRVGAEREAMSRALDLFLSQQSSQEKLRLEMAGLDAQALRDRRAELVGAQVALHRNLRLLLMPNVPPRRARLFDDVVPAPPAVADLLAAADGAMTKAVSHIGAGDREAAERGQRKVEETFAAMADIAKKRIANMTLMVRLARLNYSAREIKQRLDQLGERQLSLLEKAEDAAADRTGSTYLADQEAALSDAADDLRSELAERIRTAMVPSEHSLALPARIAEAAQSMRQAVPLLKDNKSGEAVGYQKAAIASLDGAQGLLAIHLHNRASYARMLGNTKKAEGPSIYLSEIEEEQRDMLAATRKTRPDDLPDLAVPQKNLIHAVDAILDALDPIFHLVGSGGTVVIFAKTDMDAAGTALEEKDSVEALDAQDYIVESLQDLRSEVDILIPQYRYLLEISQALYETSQEGALVGEAQRRLKEKTAAGSTLPGLAEEQGALNARAGAYSRLINEVTGLGLFVSSAEHMTAAEKLLRDGNRAAAVDKMAQAEESLADDSGALRTLIQKLASVFFKPGPPSYKVPDEVLLLRKVLGMAAPQKVVYRDCHAGKPGTVKDYEPKFREFADACGPFIENAKQHKNPVKWGEKLTEPVPPANLHLELVAAKDHLGKAAAGAKASDRAKSLASQKDASESLRHFVVEYTLKFVPLPGVMPGANVITENFLESEDEFELFDPGVVTGTRPPDGRLEWQVLGKRDRAALNENFARELPLEYRAILKDYYERLAR